MDISLGSNECVTELLAYCDPRNRELIKIFSKNAVTFLSEPTIKYIYINFTLNRGWLN